MDVVGEPASKRQRLGSEEPSNVASKAQEQPTLDSQATAEAQRPAAQRTPSEPSQPLQPAGSGLIASEIRAQGTPDRSPSAASSLQVVESVLHPAQTLHPGSAQPATPPAQAPTLHGNVGAYSQRERHAQSMEDDGTISFQYIQNDGDPNNTMRLIALKNVFSKQLPNMPKEYIARLVLDRRHRSVALAKGSCSALGGITYRPFHEQKFAEIAFCAVAANEQVKGFGTRLMNHAKEFAKKHDGIRYFLTYADNAAVGYFLKQGFTKEPQLERDVWQGFIKEYDSVTLMECEIQPQVTHTALPELFETQRGQLSARMRALSNSHVVHPGLQQFQEQGPVAIADIPGVQAAGWSAEAEDPPPFQLLLNREVHEASPANLKQLMLDVLSHIIDNDGSWPFREPVAADEVPDYYTIIKDPIDLGTMRLRVLASNHYLTLAMLTADVRRMCANARVYNAADTQFYKLADRMEGLYEQYMNAHLIFSSAPSVL